MHMTCVNFLKVLTWTSVNFWTESWTEVLSLSLAINKVPSTIRNEQHGAKNKVFKL
jgi:hypothetical protein